MPRFLKPNFYIVVFDTWGKISSGYFTGNKFNYGSYSDCLNFHHDTQDLFGGNIQGQYCMLAGGGIPNFASFKRLKLMLEGKHLDDFDSSEL